ncbi:iron-containing alcohol dehydrogenase [Thermoactinomyces mirandus]|uniref:Iron-containing alcohol dehydrogenase n=1 Tax=Thermoactinomyces mirandus TaxID=2756294 RepID=A0A7W2ARG2_9BACL|nr:iron-containing alcohol dehydrogenase [Thermoactinomyces mirandus]MBA4602317.1 iron-containing alcohol dehydrogenase [Thermoactinomyces mirandus]
MHTFTFHNPTKLIFGKGTISALKDEVPRFGKKVLLVYGGGSIKRNGIYDKTMKILNELGAEVLELSGVEPNPRLLTVHKGVELCKQENVEFLLAVGGGSVIDATKAIAAGARFDGDVWEIITKKETPKDALPFGTVLTLAATGSEMNPTSVITNWDTREKLGWGHPLVFPKFSILDPVHTFTVPRDQTVNGIVDIMAHSLEHYFSPAPNVPYNERMVEGLLLTVMETAPKLLQDLQNYEARETILFCGTMALNGVVNMGMAGDWATHGIEHAVSAMYDIPHGGGLAILFPNWIRYNLDVTTPKMKQLAIRVFGVSPEGKSDREIAEEGIDRLREFWNSLGAPSRLADYGIDDSKLDLMAEIAVSARSLGNIKKLDKEDVYEIYKMSL